MRQPSSPSEDGVGFSSQAGGTGREELFGPLFASSEVDTALGDEAFLRALLDTEAALARAQADVGIVPADAAAAIATACAGAIRLADIAAAAPAAGNPVPALVRAVEAALPPSAASWLHFGATSQDIVDTALMLVSRRALQPLLASTAAAVDTCATLAVEHRDTVMVARTLAQQAGITTFGLKTAGWLTMLDRAEARLRDVFEHQLAVQLGGATGTLGVMGGRAVDVVDRFAELVGLAVPVGAWHTDRQRLLDLATALGGTVAAAGKIALDVQLLAQTEVAEVTEGAREQGHGGSSALPHKRNPIDAILVRSAAYRAPGLIATLFATAAQHEHERAAGAWHAEWQPLRELLSVAGGASKRVAGLLAGLRVDAGRMRRAVDATGGMLMAEYLAARLLSALGRARAQGLVAECCKRAVETRQPLRDVAMSDDVVRAHLDAAAIDDALNPANSLTSSAALIDRALAAARVRRP